MKNKKIILGVLIIAVLILVLILAPVQKDTTGGLNNPTSADNAPDGSLHNLPAPEAVTVVKEQVAGEMGVDSGLVIPMSVYEREWTDSCLGLGGPAELCLLVMVPGYEITVQAQGVERVFRTNVEGTIVREEI